MARDWKQFWAGESDPHHPHSEEFIANHGREFVLLCGDPAGKRVLEFGCGSGLLFDPMGLRRAKLYRGVDASEKMLSVFRTTHRSLDLVRADAAEYTDEGKYDLIFSSSLVQYFSASMFQRHVDNARKMLAPGGRLAVGAILWRGCRAAFHLKAYGPARERRLIRGLAVLARSYAGIDRLGRWYTYRECGEAAERNGLTATYFGCLSYPYRFHVRMDDTAHA